MKNRHGYSQATALLIAIAVGWPAVSITEWPSPGLWARDDRGERKDSPYQRQPAQVAARDDLPRAKRTIHVTATGQLTAAIEDARAGDRIVIANGRYETTTPIEIQAKHGTERDPIVITAARVGGVELAGAASFRVTRSSYVMIRGFVFKHAGDGTRLAGSHHVRVTRNTFELTGTEQSHWLSIDGEGSHHNRVDHNTFANKSTQGCFLTIGGNREATTISQHDVIDHNHFFNHTFGGENGGEAIRIGLSRLQLLSARTTVEHNLFERCNGDPEVISIKSSDNLIRANTLRDSTGAIVLRHGHREVIDGNFFLPGQGGGIRVYGNDQIIINNYFERTTGVDRPPINIGFGSFEDATGTEAGYDRVDRALVAFNTLVGNAAHVVIGKIGPASAGTIPPGSIRFANNILLGDTGTLVVGPTDGSAWEGNILWGLADPGVIPRSGFRRIDPQFVREADRLMRPLLVSPARRAAAATNVSVTTDMDGQQRTEPRDVGADQVSRESVRSRPLTRVDVGPFANGNSRGRATFSGQ